MTVSNLALTLRERNDETIFVTITQNPGGAPYSLVGHNVECWIKSSAQAADTDPDSFVMSTVTGEVTITDAAAGTAQIEVPSANLPAPGIRFVRIDVLSAAGKRKTAAYGQMNIIDL